MLNGELAFWGSRSCPANVVGCKVHVLPVYGLSVLDLEKLFPLRPYWVCDLLDFLYWLKQNTGLLCEYEGKYTRLTLHPLWEATVSLT